MNKQGNLQMNKDLDALVKNLNVVVFAKLGLLAAISVSVIFNSMKDPATIIPVTPSFIKQYQSHYRFKTEAGIRANPDCVNAELQMVLAEPEETIEPVFFYMLPRFSGNKGLNEFAYITGWDITGRPYDTLSSANLLEDLGAIVTKCKVS